MQLSRKALIYLRRAYRRILTKCHFYNTLLPGLVASALLCASSLLAQADALQVTATNNAVTIEGAQQGDTIQINGVSGNQAEINIGNGASLTLAGTGRDSPLSNIANNIFNINSGSLQFGQSGASAGGSLANSMFHINNGELTLTGAWFGMGGSIASGYHNTPSTINVTNGATWTLRTIGSTTNPIEILRQEKGNIILSGGIVVNDLEMSNSYIRAANNIDADNNDFMFNDPSVTLYTSSIHSVNGNIFLGDVTAIASGEHSLNWSGIDAERGNIIIQGNVTVGGDDDASSEDFTDIVAQAGNITINNGTITDHDTGHLRLRAAQNITVQGDVIALDVNAGNTLTATNVDAWSLTASRAEIAQNLIVEKYSATLKGTGAEASHVGGNMALNGVTASLADVNVDGSATLSNANGSFSNLVVGGTYDQAGGEMSGTALSAGAVRMASSTAQTSLKLSSTLAWNTDLTVGQNSSLDVENLSTESGAINLVNGGSLTSGSVGAADKPISAISASGNSSLTSKNGIWAASLDVDNATITAQSGNIDINGPGISINGGSIEATAGDVSLTGDATAGADASTIKAGGI